MTLDGLALRPDGPTLSLSVRAGEAVAIMGPARSGRSGLLKACAGRERPVRGRVAAAGEFAVAGETTGARRLRVAAAARATGHPKSSDLLALFDLWESRNDAVSDLASGQRAAVDLLDPLLGGCPLLAIDGHLDRLDPWAHTVAWDALRTARESGAAALIVTDRPETAALCDTVVVLRDRAVRFAGSVEALRRLGPPHALTVTTERQIGVRALVSPFEVTIEEVSEGLRMEAREGQELAARLLREGYGDVRFLVSRAPTVEEGLQSL